jgi:hypothetical protein
MIRCSLDESLLEEKDGLRRHLLAFAHNEGERGAQIKEIPIPENLSSAIKDCFKLTGISGSMHRNHFGSEIAHHYSTKGYKRSRKDDGTLLWFERNQTREAVEITYSPKEREIIFTIAPY